MTLNLLTVPGTFPIRKTLILYNTELGGFSHKEEDKIKATDKTCR